MTPAKSSDSGTKNKETYMQDMNDLLPFGKRKMPYRVGTRWQPRKNTTTTPATILSRVSRQQCTKKHKRVFGLDHLNDSEAECFVFSSEKKNTERFVEGKSWCHLCGASVS